jgi:hypothetical protein
MDTSCLAVLAMAHTEAVGVRRRQSHASVHQKRFAAAINTKYGYNEERRLLTLKVPETCVI